MPELSSMNKSLSVIVLAKKWLKKREKGAKYNEEQSIITNISNKRDDLQKRKLNKSVSYNLESKSSVQFSLGNNKTQDHVMNSQQGMKFIEEVSHRKQIKSKAFESNKSSSKRKFSLKVRKLQLTKSESMSNSCPDLNKAINRERQRKKDNIKDDFMLMVSESTCPENYSQIIDRNTVDLFCDNSPPKSTNLLDIYFE